MSKRLKLRRSDGRVYLDRRGVECRWCGVFLHNIAAPDPGTVPHDHPWWFASFILWGGYTEYIWRSREVHERFFPDSKFPGPFPVAGLRSSQIRNRRRWSLRTVRLDQCHQIVQVKPHTWTLVVRGPKVRTWGFYAPHFTYWEHLPREQRDLSVDEIG